MRAPTVDQVVSNIALDLVVAVLGNKLAEVEVSTSMTSPTVRPTARVRTYSASRSRDGERLQGVVFTSLWSSPEQVLRLDRGLVLLDDGLVHERLRTLPRGELLRVQFADVRWPFTDLQVVRLLLTAKAAL
jgi:hypothetical protein